MWMRTSSSKTCTGERPLVKQRTHILFSSAFWRISVAISCATTLLPSSAVVVMCVLSFSNLEIPDNSNAELGE